MTACWSPDLPRKPSTSFHTFNDFRARVDFLARGWQKQRDAVLQEFGENAAGADHQGQAKLRIGS